MPCSGYLVTSEDTTLLLDCGSGVFPALVEYVDLRRLSAVWISHMHPDHCADLITLAQWALNADNAPRLRVLGPPEWETRLNWFLTGDGSRDLARELFEVEYLDDGAVTSVGGLALNSRLVQHSVTSFGVRVAGGNSTFAYSGDTGPCRSLEQLADNVDVLLCEAGARKPGPYHMTIQQACELGRAANVGKLLITHVPDGTPASEPCESSGLAVEIVHPRGEWLIPRTDVR